MSFSKIIEGGNFAVECFSKIFLIVVFSTVIPRFWRFMVKETRRVIGKENLKNMKME